ncbi:MAG: hypothetical protein COA42_05640 [Alteromonadaceae bacterium]|nr:MAG: hypothetical protein COA42_05640 [Alteromonadaceae bacterium]
MAIRVLVVDEAAFVRDSLKRALRKFMADVDVFDAINGGRAIAVLKANKIDLLLTDWDLPETSGADLIQWVRKIDRYEKLPIILVSSDTDRNMLQAAAELKVNDFLSKPFSPDDVQKKVVKQLARIGCMPKQRPGSGMGGVSSGLEALTGRVKPVVQKPRKVMEANFGGAAKRPRKPPVRGGLAESARQPLGCLAELNFSGFQLRCQVSDVNLQTLTGVVPRTDNIPALYAQVNVDVQTAKSEPIASLRGFVQGVQAGDPRPDSKQVRISLRFLESSPEDLELLSNFLAR